MGWVEMKLKYLSELAYIVLSHQYTDLGCARQNVSQMCPELTKFLLLSSWLVSVLLKVYHSAIELEAL